MALQAPAVDVEAMATGRLTLASDADQRPRMGVCGRKLSEDLVWDALIEKWATKLVGAFIQA